MELISPLLNIGGAGAGAGIEVDSTIPYQPFALKYGPQRFEEMVG